MATDSDVRGDSTGEDAGWLLVVDSLLALDLGGSESGVEAGVVGSVETTSVAVSGRVESVCAPPVLTATPGGAEVVVDPVEVDTVGGVAPVVDVAGAVGV